MSGFTAAISEAIFAAIASDGIWLLAITALVAGLVRGFAGFGTAMVYLPVAGQILPPFEALTTLMVMDLIGPLPNLPRAFRISDRLDILRLSLGALIAVPLGVLVLGLIEPAMFRYGVSLIAIALLILLISGFRYQGKLRPRMIFGTGAIGGFLAGSVGLPGPPVIMLYMASPHPVAVIRANIMVYLLLVDLVMIAVLQINGFFGGLGAGLGGVVGAALSGGKCAGWLAVSGHGLKALTAQLPIPLSPYRR